MFTLAIITLLGTEWILLLKQVHGALFAAPTTESPPTWAEQQHKSKADLWRVQEDSNVSLCSFNFSLST